MLPSTTSQKMKRLPKSAVHIELALVLLWLGHKITWKCQDCSASIQIDGDMGKYQSLDSE